MASAEMMLTMIPVTDAKPLNDCGQEPNFECRRALTLGRPRGIMRTAAVYRVHEDNRQNIRWPWFDCLSHG